MIRGQVPVRFLRLGEHLVNVEAIQQVWLGKNDDSATVTLVGPRKSLQQIKLPGPAGRELWQFVADNLVVAEFVTEPPKPAETKTKGTKKRKGQARKARAAQV